MKKIQLKLHCACYCKLSIDNMINDSGTNWCLFFAECFQCDKDDDDGSFKLQPPISVQSPRGQQGPRTRTSNLKSWTSHDRNWRHSCFKQTTKLRWQWPKFRILDFSRYVVEDFGLVCRCFNLILSMLLFFEVLLPLLGLLLRSILGMFSAFRGLYQMPTNER